MQRAPEMVTTTLHISKVYALSFVEMCLCCAQLSLLIQSNLAEIFAERLSTPNDFA